jgi:hypothetical protein
MCQMSLLRSWGMAPRRFYKHSAPTALGTWNLLAASLDISLARQPRIIYRKNHCKAETVASIRL